MVERGGAARSFRIPNIRVETLRAVITSQASSKSHFRTDELHAYGGIGKGFASHKTVNHWLNEYVRGDAYMNTVERFFSILKRGVYGTYPVHFRSALASIPGRV